MQRGLRRRVRHIHNRLSITPFPGTLTASFLVRHYSEKSPQLAEVRPFARRHRYHYDV
jgi:CTP-dependent riboflavin kinase